MNKDLPCILLKLAISEDGYLDDKSSERLILSNLEDRSAVDQIRSEIDAILVGANTVRKDNPLLTIKNPELRQNRILAGKTMPYRIIISRSGVFPKDAEIFSNQAPTIIFSNQFTPQGLNQVRVLPLPSSLLDLAKQLKSMGVNQLLVEGGLNMINQFLELRLFNQFRLAISPLILRENGAESLKFDLDKLLGLTLTKEENLKEMKVLWFEK